MTDAERTAGEAATGAGDASRPVCEHGYYPAMCIAGGLDCAHAKPHNTVFELSVSCPVCGAAASNWCVDRSGSEIVRLHIKRTNVAIWSTQKIEDGGSNA